jgi:hypothetical protein
MRKIFPHCLVESIDLKCKMGENGRFYVAPNGEHLRSVTTILDEKLNKDWLKEWKRRVGEEKADRIKRKAAKRGTAVHDMAQRYLLNEKDYIKGTLPHYVMAFDSVKKVLDKHVGVIYAIETPLYSLTLKTAGRIDLVAEYDEILSVIDFKTANRKRIEEQIHSYFLQTTAYSLMFERLYNINISQIVIIMTVDNEPEAQIFIKNRNDYVKEVLEIFVGV